MIRRNNRGGGATTTTKGAVAIKRLKAREACNQESLDRLTDLAEKAAAQSNSNYIFTLKRAMKSLQQCGHPITTLEEALELKYVGERLARLVVPTSSSSITSTVAVPRPRSTAASTAASTTARRQKRATPNSTTSTTTTSTKVSAKEQAYLQAKHEAEALATSLPSGPWKMILLVDIREHKSQKVVAKCQQSGIPCEERSLPIGDMAWIVRCGDIELLVGTILERKQVDDLAGSIYGTRFAEQRLRLHHCGLSQILYLVEGDLTSVVNCPADTLRMAMMETRTALGFGVIHTHHLDHTVQTLKGLHRRLVQRTFPNKLEELPTFAGRNSGGNGRKQRRASSLLEMVFDTAPLAPFGESRFTTYTELKAKIERDREAGTRTVGAIYGAMLKQVASLSQKKCQGIANVYPTMNRLLQAYQQVTTTTNEDSTTATSSSKETTMTKNQPRLQLVQEVTLGQQRVGPKSAAELDIACCMKDDGTLLTLKNAVTVQHPEPGALALQSRASTSKEAATTGTLSTTSLSPVARRETQKTAPTVSSVAVATIPPSAPSFQATYEPAWCNDDDDDDFLQDKEAPRTNSQVGLDAPAARPINSTETTGYQKKKPTIFDLLSEDDDTPKKPPASKTTTAKRAVPSTSTFLFSSDDEDGSSPKKPRASPPARTISDPTSSDGDNTSPGQGAAIAGLLTATRPLLSRASLSEDDSSEPFSSPSTISSAVKMSQGSTTNRASRDVTIVEIDDSSDEDECCQRGGVELGNPTTAMVTTTIPMEKETIVID